MTVEIISRSISAKVWVQAGVELATPGSAVRLALLPDTLSTALRVISSVLLNLVHLGLSLDQPKHLSLGAWIFIEKDINLQQKRLGDFSSISECKTKVKTKEKIRK